MWAGSRDIGGDYLSGGVELNGWAEEVTVDWVIVGRIGEWRRRWCKRCLEE